ncbi:hypothetical protein PV08_06466 [Exophiala spinifera]|uniref:Calcineurin-like phosphoesterase domain-containing protein n=1 Tax=Exophiala spinifera TaxID=91928 RepID=A0A0D2BYM0_9EURO|nr:uncharacterized protein PV08_06466 [Exophiala spinifera]KIW16414.1 hypothetical protein PV08_06466 [Exophiala spinifera]
MAVQVMSDLHLETPKAYDVFTITPKAPYLALLGDIGNIQHDKDDYLAFLTLQLKQFRAVLLVPGNHEAYHSNWPATLDALRDFEQNVRKDATLGEFVLLERTIFRPPDSNTAILGCSLFSFIPATHEMAVSHGLNDFFHTHDWDIAMHNEAHRRDLAWLNARVEELGQSNAKIMIFSHWSPSLDVRAIDPRHAASPITSAFSTELCREPCFQSDKVALWAFGHTHFNCDFTVERASHPAGPLRLLANQRGYYFAQANGFDVEKTVEI